jgi:small subunit ribosomal protein S1
MSNTDQPQQPTNPGSDRPRNAADRFREKMRERPEFKPGRPPPLDAEQSTKAPRLRDLDAAIEEELNAAMAGMSKEDLYGSEERRDQRPAPGEPAARKKGRVVAIHGGDVFVDVPGGRSQGYLPLEQFEEGPPAVGSEVEVDIEGYDQANGLLRLTRKGAAIAVDWSSVAQGQVVEARVTGTNKGGLAVEVNGIRGFLPISQIDLYRVEQPEQFLNQRLKCMVTEVDPEERNLVVSRRALLEREREENREKLWNELEEGQERSGVVRNVQKFGVFVDLGGVDGLVPISEMSWARVSDPTQIVSPGQRVQVKVLRLDRDARKVALSLRALQAGPWDGITQRYHVGQVVTAKVTRIAEYGAFAELEPGVEGLIHVSELGTQRTRRVRDAVSEGQDVVVGVLSIDPAQRRMSLSIKAALSKARAAEAAAAAAAAETEEEPETPAKPKRPRTTPLRGGIGGQLIELPPVEDEGERPA